jgi:hypothetical protein
VTALRTHSHAPERRDKPEQSLRIPKSGAEKREKSMHSIKMLKILQRYILSKILNGNIIIIYWKQK